MKDVAESVLARLLNIAKANGLVYNELLMRYILERIFYRVGKSRHSGKFILEISDFLTPVVNRLNT